jgi:hypothetical protein
VSHQLFVLVFTCEVATHLDLSKLDVSYGSNTHSLDIVWAILGCVQSRLYFDFITSRLLCTAAEVKTRFRPLEEGTFPTKGRCFIIYKISTKKAAAHAIFSITRKVRWLKCRPTFDFYRHRKKKRQQQVSFAFGIMFGKQRLVTQHCTDWLWPDC